MANGLTGTVASYRRHRFAWLFGSLLLTLGAGPTLDELFPRWNPLVVLLAINLAAAIATVAHEHSTLLPLLVAGTFVLTRGLLASLGVPGMPALGEGLWVLGVVLATGATVRHAFGRSAVDGEHILAALDTYLLAGLLFSVAYSMMERQWPGSFSTPNAAAFDLPHAIYFSFVTIAALGYGDIVPVSGPARGLTVVEAVAGQLYLAVLVARLVGLYAREQR